MPEEDFHLSVLVRFQAHSPRRKPGETITEKYKSAVRRGSRLFLPAFAPCGALVAGSCGSPGLRRGYAAGSTKAVTGPRLFGMRQSGP